MPTTHDKPDSPPEWTELSRCLEVGDPDLWFPEKGGTARPAKRICRSCEVRAECLEYALDNNVRHGVWGGMSERELRGIRQRNERLGIAA